MFLGKLRSPLLTVLLACVLSGRGAPRESDTGDHTKSGEAKRPVEAARQGSRHVAARMAVRSHRGPAVRHLAARPRLARGQREGRACVGEDHGPKQDRRTLEDGLVGELGDTRKTLSRGNGTAWKGP